MATERAESNPMIPTRYVNLEAARARFGERADRLAGFLMKEDPLADAAANAIAELGRDRAWALFERGAAKGVASIPEAPSALRDFFAFAEATPVWADRDAIDRGGVALVRSGDLGGAVLGVMSLVLGYAAPGGNKPLVFSGRLRENATRRLNETARFVQAVTKQGGMRVFADGYQITLKVRLMHAQVRRMIARSGRWDDAKWGAPINQHDMGATNLLFSLIVLRGLRDLGIRIEPGEAERYMHLWRYVGHLIGVEGELLCASEADATRLAELIAATQGPPDEDSRALVAALFDAGGTTATSAREKKSAARRRSFGIGLCRALLGDALADQLGVERTSWRLWVPALRRIVRGIEHVRGSNAATDAIAVRAGERYWERVVTLGSEGKPPDFRPPESLARPA